ncbi:MAG: enoyl-CoA hydratase/isomerase family protein [Pseudomonadota bacterium]
MSDIAIRAEGRVGHITLTRPKALNALTWDMALAIEQALDGWADDPDIAMVLIDAEGDRAFCAGGDLQALYESGRAGDYGYGQRFWADEYRLNAKIAAFPKPYVALCQGFVMGGGVGIACHGSHRVVTETTQIAMPECGIGLIPDVGGSLLLARAEGHLGAYLGLTGARMRGIDAVVAGFADLMIGTEELPGLTARLLETGKADEVYAFGRSGVASPLADLQSAVDAVFSAPAPVEIAARLQRWDTGWAADAHSALQRASPLSLHCALATIRAAQARSDAPDALRHALRREYRFTARCMAQGDFLEGIRAQIIDKDRRPRWRHAGLSDVPPEDVEAMCAFLEEHELTL